MTIAELPFSYFLDPSERLFWGYLLSSALIAFLVVTWRSEKVFSASAVKRYWLHPSAIVDYQYFFLMCFIKVYLLAPLLFSAQEVALWTQRWSRDYLEPLFDVRYQTVGWLYTIALFLASDFTRYWLHRALHAFDCLWAFHKVHHSAEVLNPLTFYRIHPVESLLFGLRYSLTAGVVTGIFMTLFGAKLHTQQVIGVNGFLFTFSVLGSNLRHSHVYWGFPRWLESLIISPAQHQLHHQYRYSRSNYGGALAIWDWMFGSLRRSRDSEKPAHFGIAREEMRDFNSLIKLLWTPVKEVFRSLS